MLYFTNNVFTSSLASSFIRRVDGIAIIFHLVFPIDGIWGVAYFVKLICQVSCFVKMADDVVFNEAVVIKNLMRELKGKSRHVTHERLGNYTAIIGYYTVNGC